MITTEEVLRAAERLGRAPKELSALIELLKREEVQVEDVTQLVLRDPGLAAQLLRRANAVDVGGAVPVADVASAVMRLGTAQSLAVLFAVAVGDPLGQPLYAYGLQDGDLLRFGQVASYVASDLRERTPEPVAEIAVTAALLQDIGKLVLAELIQPDQLVQMRTLRATSDLDASAVEREVLGIDSSTAGGLLAEYWGFPEVLCRAIAGHCSPDCVPDPISDLVHLSGIVTRMLGIERGFEGLAVECSSSALMRLGLDGTDLIGSMSSVAQTFDHQLQGGPEPAEPRDI